MDAEVAIVGAGAAGGIMALELARRGVEVVVVEAGPRHDLAVRGEYARQWLRHQNPWRSPIGELDRHTTSGRNPYVLEWRRVRGVGGSTLHWEGYALRLHADDFRLRSLHGVGDDWPIGYADLEPYYGRAEAALGVAGVADDPRASPRSTGFPLPAFPFSHSDRLFAPAARAAGIALSHLPQARNSEPYGGRVRCQACSICHACPTGAKASVDLTHVAQAEASGRVRVLADTSVLRLVLGRNGEAEAAVCAGPDRAERRVRARVFVVAGGAVETARLLLLSASREFPDGLANRSGLVGRYFMTHPSIDVTARARERVHPYRIGFSTAMSRDFAVGGDRGRRAAFLLEFLNSAGPTPERLAVTSGLWGRALRERVRAEFGRTLGVRVYCEQLADRTNAVTLNRHVRDHFGNPVPHIRLSVGAYERRGLDEARAVVARVFAAMGLTEVEVSAKGFAAHQIGTHRMGTDPAASVVDPQCRAHDVPNLYLVGAGCFVTASASPPTLTIAALAIRAAEHIAAGLRPSAVGAPPAASPHDAAAPPAGGVSR